MLRFLLVFFPVTVAINFDNRGMVNDPIDGSDCHHGIREYLIPVAKGLVR